MKITTVVTKDAEGSDFDEIVFFLFQPSEVQSLQDHVGYLNNVAEVPINCKAVIAAHVFRADPVLGDLYERGFAFCAGVDQFDAVKGMKIALEQAASRFRLAKRVSPWEGVMKSHLRNAFMGVPSAVEKLNKDVESRTTFNPYVYRSR
jgi:hypothetical protein